MEDPCDVAVVGAGAAGLAAAIFAAEAARERGTRPRVLVLDGAERIGAKILISGGGRCNVTHGVIEAADFNGTPHVVRHVLAAFDADAAARWFRSLGVPLKREQTGKLFPVSNSARTVVDALLARCRALGVQVLPGHRVLDVCTVTESASPDCEPALPLFDIVHGRGRLRARRLIMATGGRSVPKTGSDGAGWQMVQRLGHSVTAGYPALVPLVLTPDMFHARLSGLSHPAELSVFAAGKLIDRRSGSLLWTHFGVSGPVVLDASRHWTVSTGAERAVELRCSVMPGRSFDDVDAFLAGQTGPVARQQLATLLGAALPRRLAEEIIVRADLDPATPAGQLARAGRHRLAHMLTGMVLPVMRDRGWNYAEVTAGGVPLNEIDFRSMQSRKLSGLYLVGEMLDCDGRIGGFNFQWAWSTGYLAGRAVAASLAGAAGGASSADV